MKNQLLKLVLLLFISGVMTYQTRAQSALHFGIRGGLNFAHVIHSQRDTDVRRGFSAGGYYRYSFPGSRLSLQPELLYTQKGFNRDNLTTRLDYLEVPVLLNLSLFGKRSFSPRIYAGPYMAFNVRADPA